MRGRFVYFSTNLLAGLGDLASQKNFICSKLITLGLNETKAGLWAPPLTSPKVRLNFEGGLKGVGLTTTTDIGVRFNL